MMSGPYVSKAIIRRIFLRFHCTFRQLPAGSPRISMYLCYYIINLCFASESSWVPTFNINFCMRKNLEAGIEGSCKMLEVKWKSA